MNKNHVAKTIHEDCLKAACLCPQFQGIAYYNWSSGEKNGNKIGYDLNETLKYWSCETVLWKAGYYQFLNSFTLEQFNKYVADEGWKILPRIHI